MKHTQFAAPEVLYTLDDPNTQYGKESDIWSIGGSFLVTKRF